MVAIAFLTAAQKYSAHLPFAPEFAITDNIQCFAVRYSTPSMLLGKREESCLVFLRFC